VKIKFIRDYRGRKAGTTWEPQDGVANVLIRRNIAEQVRPRGRPKKGTEKRVKSGT